MLLKFLSWNVNGLRAISKKEQWKWFTDTDAQIVALQETKASPRQLKPEIANPAGWHAYWDSSVVKKGYSGVSVFTRTEPLTATAQLPDPAFQGEGRLLHLEFEKFHFFNGYFPNGGAAEVDENGKPTGKYRRVPYKLGFLDAFLDLAITCEKSKPVVVCGDFNIAHQAIDLANPEAHVGTTGFLPEERAWMDKLVKAGFVDSFRHVHGPTPNQFTWWSYRQRGRDRNIGWRLDYFFVSRALQNQVRDAWIETDVTGSDHCPVGLALEI